MIQAAIGAGQKTTMLLLCICMSCVRAKNTVQSLLRDVGQCCKEAALPSKALWRHGTCCSVVSQ